MLRDTSELSAHAACVRSCVGCMPPRPACTAVRCNRITTSPRRAADNRNAESFLLKDENVLFQLAILQSVQSVSSWFCTAHPQGFVFKSAKVTSVISTLLHERLQGQVYDPVTGTQVCERAVEWRFGSTRSYLCRIIINHGPHPDGHVAAAMGILCGTDGESSGRGYQRARQGSWIRPAQAYCGGETGHA